MQLETMLDGPTLYYPDYLHLVHQADDFREREDEADSENPDNGQHNVNNMDSCMVVDVPPIYDSQYSWGWRRRRKDGRYIMRREERKMWVSRHITYTKHPHKIGVLVKKTKTRRHTLIDRTKVLGPYLIPPAFSEDEESEEEAERRREAREQHDTETGKESDASASG